MKPLTLPEIRAMGFEPSSRGWLPRSSAARRAIEEADERRITPRPQAPPPWPDRLKECFVCGWPEAEFSSVGTPTCSEECLEIAFQQDLPEITDRLEGRRPPKHFDWEKYEILARQPKKPGEKSSPKRALERLGTCEDVLSRHGVTLRHRRALCPFHEERTPSLSLFTGRSGQSLAKCFGCGWFGDAVELEVGLSGSTKSAVIERWGR